MQKDIDNEEVWEARREFPQATNTKSISAAMETNEQSAVPSCESIPKAKGSYSYVQHDSLTALSNTNHTVRHWLADTAENRQATELLQV